MPEVISFDLETALIEPGLFFPRIAAAVFATHGNTEIVLRHQIAERLRPVLETGVVIGTNLGFDIGCCMVHIPELIEPWLKALRESRVVCIDTLQRLIDIGKGELNRHGAYSLENIAARWGIPLPEKHSGWRLAFDGLRDIPPESWPEDARKYLLDDGDVPLKVVFKQLSSGAHNLQRAGLESFYDVALYATAAEGFPIHPKRLELAESRVTEHREALHAELVKTGLVRPDGSKDTKKCMALVEASFPPGKAPRTAPGKRNPEGQIKTDKDTLERCHHPTLKLYSEYTTVAGSARARIERLKEALASKHGRLHTRFVSLVDTGRTSSQETSMHPSCQGQNWHRGPVKWGDKETNLRLRECLTSAPPAPWSISPVGAEDPDWIMLAADFTAAEMFALAQSCMDRFKFSKLGELLLAGIDPHAWYAGVTMGLTLEQVNVRTDKKKLRNRVKPQNFGFPGGLGPKTFVDFARIQYGQIYSMEEAAHYREVWFTALPEMREHLAWVSRLLAGGRGVDITTTRGGLVMGQRGFCNGANAMFQPPTAMGAKAAHAALWSDSLTPGNTLYGNFRVANFVHDESVGFVRRAAVAEVAPYIRERMRTIFTDLVCPSYPIDVEISVGNVWNKTAPDIKWSKPINDQVYDYEASERP